MESKQKSKKVAAKRDPWTFSFSTNGYVVMFEGSPVGGTATLSRPKHWKTQLANLNMFKRLGANAVVECRALHKKKPFRPAKHGNIWVWRKDVNAY